MIIIMIILGFFSLFFTVTSLVIINKKNTVFNLTFTRIAGVLTLLFLLFALVCVLVNEELKQKLNKKPEKFEPVQEQLYRKK